MDNKIKTFAIVIFTFVVICFISISVLLCTLPDTPTIVQKDQICLQNESGFLKCGKTTELLHNYLESVIEDQYVMVKKIEKEKQQDYIDKNWPRLVKIYDKNYLEMKPAAKLTGKEQPPLQKADVEANMITIREWQQGDGLRATNGFMKYGIRYVNGRLVVPVDGTYFIYSNIDYFEECITLTGIPNVQDINKPIKQGIFKFNILHGTDEELVSNIQPHSICANSYYTSYSSYVSSLAELKAGDELSVKVSNITSLRYTKDNYFGVNLI